MSLLVVENGNIVASKSTPDYLTQQHGDVLMHSGCAYGLNNNYWSEGGIWSVGIEPSQWDYDPLLTKGIYYDPAANFSYIQNTSGNNLDGIRWKENPLTPGTYEIKVVTINHPGGGIFNVVWNYVYLGDIDTYAAATTYNVVNTVTYSPTHYKDGYIMLYVTSKNAASSGWNIKVSRIQIRKTA